MNKTISHDKPREKLLNQGCAYLSNAELLAVLFGTGVKGKDVLSLSVDLLHKFGGLRGLASTPLPVLVEEKGMGPAQACKWMAVSELFRRLAEEKVMGNGCIHSPDELYEFLKYELRDLDQEIFRVVLLSKKMEVLQSKDLFRGTIDESVIYPREIIKLILSSKACSVIFVHNHPSGDCHPSQMDITLTKKMVEICNLIQVQVRDHLIVGHNDYYSFSEAGLLESMMQEKT